MPVTRLTADEVKAGKERLSMSYDSIAKRLSVKPRTVMRWAKQGVGGTSAILFNILLQHEGAKNV